MDCKKNELQEAIDWDEYGTPIQFKCVAAPDKSGKSGISDGFGGSSWIDWFKVLSGATTSVILATKGQQSMPGNQSRTYDPTFGNSKDEEKERDGGGIIPIWWVVGAVVIGGFLWLITGGNSKK